MSTIVFIRAYPRNPTTGAIVGVPMAGGGWYSPYYRDGVHYSAGVVLPPTFSAAIGFDKNGVNGGVIPTVTAISFAPADPATLDYYAAFYWVGADIEIDVGDEQTGATRVLTGTVADATVRDGALIITAADLSLKVDRPLLTSYFAGTGGIEGAAVAEGRVKRRSFGRVFNIEGRPLDPANNIYEFGDPARPIQNCTALRDKGRAGSLSILGWQGSIAATLTALIASSPPSGGGVFAPSINCAKWWRQPAGPLTADLRGEIGAGYTETAAGIAAALLASVDGPTIANLAEGIALRPAPVGLHIATDSETAAAALDRLLLPMSLLWRLDPAGQIDIRTVAFGAFADGDAETVYGEFKGRERTIPPTRTRRVGYQRNHRQHSDGEISEALLSTDVAYADGTTIEALKPAESGGNRTETRVSAAFQGQGYLATQNYAYASHVVIGAKDNILPDAAYQDAAMWPWGPNMAFQDMDSFWDFPRAWRCNSDRDFASFSPYFDVEPGATYRIRVRIWNNGAEGWSGAFWPLIHMPAVAWYSLKHGYPVNPEIADASNAIVANGDTFYLEFTVKNQSAARQWQLHFKSTARGSPVVIQLMISKVAQVGKDVVKTSGSVYAVAELETVLGVASAIAGQGVGATANNLAQLDPTAKAQLDAVSSGGGGSRTVGLYDIITVALEPGASIAVEAEAHVDGASSGTNGTIAVRIQVSPSGTASWSTVAQSSNQLVGPFEPGGMGISGSYTNTFGVKKVFDFRAIDVRLGPNAGGNIDETRSYLTV